MAIFRSKVEPVLQAETSECGLACLSMLFSWHKRHISLRSLRAENPSPDAGVNLQKLMRIATQHGLAPRAVRLELGELRELELPCVLHWDYSHYVVLEKVGLRGCVIIDPAVGRRRYNLMEVSAHFTGVALELSPSLSFETKRPERHLKLADFIPSRKKLAGYLGKIIALSVVLQGLALLSPYYIQTVVDDVLSRGDADFLLVLALGFAMVLSLEVLLSALRSWTGTVFGQRLSFEIASTLLDRLLSLPLGWFATRQTGDIASRFSSFESMRSFLTQGVAFSIIDGVMAICFIVVMWLYAPQLTLVVLTSVVLYLLLRLLMLNPQREASSEHLVASARQSGLFLESIKHINSLKSYSSESTRTRMWEKAYSTEVNTSLRIARLSLTFGQCQALLFGLENVLVIYLGASLIIEGPNATSTPLTIGMLYAFIAYKNQFKDRVAGLVNYLIEFRLLRVHLERLSDIVLAEPEVLELTGALPVPELSPHLLEVKHLSFAYADRLPLFTDLSLQLAPGQSLAIGGPSGCGKSTLLKLIASLMPLQQGEIRLQGRARKNCPLPVWRSMIASVTQEDGLLAGTLIENISMFAADAGSSADIEKLESIGALVGLTPMIELLPLKWDTKLGELGIALSAGQQQRVLLARALYAEPDLLILDEATAHLDEQAEAQIFTALRGLGVSFLVVSHRASVHRFADYSLSLADASVGADRLPALPDLEAEAK